MKHLLLLSFALAGTFLASLVNAQVSCTRGELQRAMDLYIDAQTNGGSGAPDTHLFRVENGRLRYVHTLTHLLQSGFQGAN